MNWFAANWWGGNWFASNFSGGGGGGGGEGFGVAGPSVIDLFPTGTVAYPYGIRRRTF